MESNPSGVKDQRDRNTVHFHWIFYQIYDLTCSYFVGVTLK